MYLSRYKAFEILELNPNKKHTDDDIKRAYRKKALECHPDKETGNSEEFIRVKVAYEVLTSKTASSVDYDYDIMLSKLFKTLSEMMTKVISKNMPRPSAPKEEEDVFHDAFEEEYDESSADIIIHILVSLKELYSEDGKKLKVKYKTREGTTERHIVYISFNDYMLEYVFEDKGDWDSFLGKYGKLVVHINIVNCDHYIINSCVDKSDLILSVPISISDYYLGIDTTIDHFGEPIKVLFKPLENNICSCIFKDKGLKARHRRGDLHVLFDIQLNHHDADALSNDKLELFFPTLL